MRVLRICGCLVLVMLILAGCGAAPDLSDPDTAETPDINTASDHLPNQGTPPSGSADIIDCDSQLQLIADQAAVWMGDTELVFEPFFYAVTDLDQNGRLEIIQSSCQGTGLFTYSNFWEVDTDSAALVPCLFSVAEGDSQPDIITDPDMVYFDKPNNCYFYIFRDEIRNGAAEHYQSVIALSLRDGVVTATPLAHSHSIYGPEAITAYTDADGNTMDENAYNMAAENAYAGLTAMKATIGWTDASISEQLASLTASELMDILDTSWNSFFLA